MKKLRIALWVLMLLPIAATVICLFFLPDQVPAHYGLDGQIDRWGSKYETLVFPVISVVTGFLMLGAAKMARKHTPGEQNERSVLITGVAVGVMFCAMTAYFLLMDFQRVRDLDAVPIALTQLMFGVLGLMMIVFGFIMPGLTRNSLIGLRTEKTLASDENWRKSQRFGGISFMIGGVLMILLCLLTRGALCFWLSMAVLLAVVIADAVYAHRL